MTGPISNPLGQQMAMQARAEMAARDTARERAMRTYSSLSIIVIGVSLLTVAGALAFGWAGGLAVPGLALVALGVLLGMFRN